MADSQPAVVDVGGRGIATAIAGRDGHDRRGGWCQRWMAMVVLTTTHDHHAGRDKHDRRADGGDGRDGQDGQDGRGGHGRCGAWLAGLAVVAALARGYGWGLPPPPLRLKKPVFCARDKVHVGEGTRSLREQ